MMEIEIGRDLEIRRRSSKRSDDDSSIYQARNILKVGKFGRKPSGTTIDFHWIPTKADHSTKVFAPFFHFALPTRS